jgi:glycosyl transferase family 87
LGLQFFRDANWLGPARARAYLWLLAATSVVLLLFLVVTARAGVDRNGFLLGTDFLSFWTAGRMLVGGADVYDTAAHIAAQRQYYAAAGGYTAFFYPPPFLLAVYPLGFLPYFAALALWLAATGAAYCAVVRLWLQSCAVHWPVWLLAVAFPPVLITVTHGQTSFLVAALLGAGVLWIGPRPILAGVCFGLATIKPQFGLLVPVLLLVTGQWRVIAVAAATAVALALTVTLLFGMHVWSDWLEVSHAARTALEQGSVGFAKMQSPFAGARLLGASVTGAYLLQAVIGVAVAGALAWAGWRRGYSLALGAAMLVGALLATPFVLDYDLVLLAFPLIYLAGVGFRTWEKLIAALAFIMPLFARPVGMQLGIPTVPLLLIPLFVVLVGRAREA